MNGAAEEIASGSIPIGMVAHWKFCPRRAWLEAMDEKAPQSGQIAQGTTAHRRVDKTSTTESDTVRGIDIRHRELGFHGRVDRVEKVSDSVIKLIEHKATPIRREPSVSDANRVQVTLQKLGLEDQGFTVAETAVYFSTHHKTVPLELTEEDVEEAQLALEHTRAVVQGETAPPPLVDDPKCMRCSHASICLPDERQEAEVRRRIMPPDRGSDVVHLTVPGSRASVKSGRMLVVNQDERLASIPLERVAAAVVHGNVDLSGALIRELMWRGLPIVWCTGAGRVVGWTNGVRPPNGGARFHQYSASAEGRLELAQEFVATKISNQATILRRFGGSAKNLEYLRSASRAAEATDSVSSLFGVEGRAASEYFTEYPTLLRNSVDRSIVDKFPGRVGRGATDPLNVSLNYGYGLLLSEVIRSILATGLDPHAGFLHTHGRNKPALALDLMEEFRAPLVDAAILGGFNNGELSASSFTHVLGAARLTQVGRKKLISAYERRLGTEFMHPVFKYRMTWRRAIEVQARMVLGVMDGTQSSYKGIRVR